MFQLKPILGFAGRFLLVFALLVAPWPGWPEAYAQFVRQGARLIYGSLSAKGIVTFRPNPSGDPSLDTVIYLANRDKLDATLTGKAALLTFSTRRVAYFPTALALSLVLATRISWRRRAWALVWGLVAMHTFVTFMLGVMISTMIWDHPWLELREAALFGPRTARVLYEVFVTYLGARFAAAVLVWILTTLRRDDWARIAGRARPANEQPPC